MKLSSQQKEALSLLIESHERIQGLQETLYAVKETYEDRNLNFSRTIIRENSLPEQFVVNHGPHAQYLVKLDAEIGEILSIEQIDVMELQSKKGEHHD